MSAILPFVTVDSSSFLARYFTPYQICWIDAEKPFHEAKKQVFALAEKSVRIGWTYCDAFKNVRKRLQFKERDYLFVTKDWPSALEYMKQAYEFASVFGLTRAVISHGEKVLKVPRPGRDGRPNSSTEKVKIGYIDFDNRSRIIAFSSNPYAMAVHGGDVGLDEFAKHPNATLLWQTAQARVTWNNDLAVWSSHDGEDTLFNQFAQQARAQCAAVVSPASPTSVPAGAPTQTPPPSPWNLYFRVTMPDAVELGLLGVINRTKSSCLTPAQFLADCKTRAGSEEIYEQSYMCNPLGTATASIVEWSAIERCRYDYPIERVHLEAADVLQRFGQFNPVNEKARERDINAFLLKKFSSLFSTPSAHGSNASQTSTKKSQLRLGFDVAASGQGDLAAIYIDEYKDSALWLRALLTARTEDWHFLKTAISAFLQRLPSLRGAGDESGLGRQICWETASAFGTRFLKVNFASKKQDLGFALMNQLSVAEKRFPRSEQDIAADFFALRKLYTGTRWVFNEGRNTFNPASHCDIAWAGALSSHAHAQRPSEVGAAVILDNGYLIGDVFHPFPERAAPWNPKQQYTMGCAFCRHRPNSYVPLLPRCKKCGLYDPAHIIPPLQK